MYTYLAIINEALKEYTSFMLDDDYDAQGALDRIITRMRERLDAHVIAPSPDSAELVEQVQAVLIQEVWPPSISWMKDAHRLLRQAAAHISAQDWKLKSLQSTLSGTEIRAEQAERALADLKAEAKVAITGMLDEWDKFTRYGSPLAKSANENVRFARAFLAKLKVEG